MHGLAEYVMRGRKQAVLMVMLFNFIPFMGWVSDIILALVTLRKGAREGALLLLWVILPSVVFAVIGYTQLWFYNVLGGSLAIYLIALILRNTASWATTLYICMFLGIASVIAVHIYNPDIAKLWNQQLAGYLKAMQVQWNTTANMTRMQEFLPVMAKISTGLQVSFLILSDLFILVFARWWQAQLYNPNQLHIELENIRLGISVIGIFGCVIIGSLFGIEVAIDSTPIVVIPFVIAGLSLLHGALRLIKASKIWLVSFYSLWVVLFPYLTILLIVTVLIDSWVDFRSRLKLSNMR